MRLMTWNINSLVRDYLSTLFGPEVVVCHAVDLTAAAQLVAQVPTVRNFVLTNGSFEAWLHQHDLQIACFQACVHI